MSTKVDVEAIRLIGEEVVRLLSLPDDRLDEAETRAGLKVIAELARWRDVVYADELALQRKG
ncbi:hypothetical protein PS870_02030 [Pseudomonas fluorescens]|uniref:Uncharacterized protein n=1 Tax=Pseudomonas fluorescens TaxID=294 RepID=A0A5E7J9P6_PSEFL|nr:hypothetical protein [Pseudomonas fluorescens]VVO85455.1 hypothetical protein PS870_02030 [Pseudomonas fluorescens]